MNRNMIQHFLQNVAGWLPQRENGLKDGDNDDRENHSAPEFVKKDRIQAPGPLRSCAAPVGGFGTHAYRPFTAVPRISKDRQLQWLRNLRRRDQKVCHRVQAFTGHRADQCDGSAKLPRQRKHVHLSTLFVQFVRHVEQNEGRQSQGDDAPGQHKVPVEVVGVEYQNDRVGALGTWHFTIQDIDSNFFIFRLWIEAVDAGKIDQRNFLARVQTEASRVVLHGDAGKVADLLAQSGQAIEERGFARIGRPHDGHSLINRQAIYRLRT